MATKEDIALFSHLMRRAGFGSTRDEIEAMAEDGYEATVEKLLNYESQEPVDDYTLYRYHPITEVPGGAAIPGQANWLYWMVNTKRPLQEKVALFWHHVFATGNAKVDNCNHLLDQIQMFRDEGMGNYRTLLVKIASDPAMIYWLDNNENHKAAPNENWGRELLELFALGQGNYTEKDVYECSRAFTGWTITPKNPAAVELMAKTLVDSNYEILPVLRLMFNSDFFKEAAYKKVRNPVEVVVGTLRMTGDLSGPDPRLEAMAREPGYMGQEILDPPSVEGWHTGHEWINSGSLVKRVNFVADRVSDTSLPGVKRIVERISGSNGPVMSPADFVEQCLNQMGPLPVSDNTRKELVSQAQTEGDINWEGSPEDSARRTGDMLALIGSTREYQFG